MSGSTQNWQARTLVGSCLADEVDTAVFNFKMALDYWQLTGDDDTGDDGESPLEDLIRTLRRLRHYGRLFDWIDRQSAHDAIDEFRKAHANRLSGEEENS